MKTSESLKSFLPAFLSAQKQITFAVKDAVNPHLKSKYADLPAVIDAIKTALNDNEIIYTQTPDSGSKDAYLLLTTRLMHISGEWMEGTLEMPLSKTDPQGYMSACTYARRAGLTSITGLYQDDDDGQGATKTKKKETISGTDGAFEKLEPKDQHRLVGVRDELDVMFSEQRDDDLFTLWRSIDQEEKPALWSMLDSKIRSHIKKLDAAARPK